MPASCSGVDSQLSMTCLVMDSWLEVSISPVKDEAVFLKLQS